MNRFILKQLFFLITLTISNLLSFNPNLLDQGMPLINHYGPPYLNPTLFSFQHDPRAVVIAPINLQKSILQQFNINAADDKTVWETIDKLIKDKTIDLNFYSIIWEKDTPTAWPADRKYNYIFHEILLKWLQKNQQAAINPENFAKNVLMGLFDPNGIEDLKVAGLAGSMPFEKLEERTVNKHDGAYSPNNANFKLEDKRIVGSFWVAAISPDKKNVVVINNIIIDDNDLQNIIAQTKETKNIKLIIEAIGHVATILNSQDKTEDASALLKFIAEFKQIEELPKHENIKDLFNESFADEIQNQFNEFDLLDANKSAEIYQIPVLSQDEGQCKLFPVIGNTCGRHAVKNSLFGAELINSFIRNSIYTFKNSYADLTTQNYKLRMQNETDLSEDAACVFKTVNDLLKNYREQKEEKEAKEGFDANTLSPAEVKYLISAAAKIGNECKILLYPITLIEDPQKYNNSQFLTNDEKLNIIKIINYARTTPAYLQSFILPAGAIAGQHWINVIVFKINNTLKYLVMDSKNAPRINDKSVIGLKNLLERFDYNPILQSTRQFLIENYETLQKQFGTFKDKKVTPSENYKIAKSFFEDLANLIFESKNFINLLKKLNEQKLLQDFETQYQMDSFIENIFNNPENNAVLKNVSNLDGLENNLKNITEYAKSKINIKTLQSEEIETQLNSAANNDILTIMQNNGVTINNVLENINRTIRKDISNTLLWLAVARSRTDFVEALLDYGADPLYRLPDSPTARTSNIVNSSIINMAKKLNKTPELKLMAEALIKNNKLAEEINKCPDVQNIMSQNGKSIADIIANVDKPIRKDIKNTLLWIASVRECLDLMDILIAMGANPFYKIPVTSLNKELIGMNVIEMLKKNNKQKAINQLSLSGFNTN